MNTEKNRRQTADGALAWPGQNLDLQFGGTITDLLPAVLTRPVSDLLSRPGKRVRGRLTRIGYQMARLSRGLSTDESEACRRMMEAIESLHAGSLAIDDLQDGSRTRRGEPALHLKYGLPIALNIGNWLYFWPLEIIRDLNLPPETELRMYRLYHRTLLRAHAGQAIDVGLPIDTIPQDRVPAVCLAAMELKSGALFSLGLLSGWLVGEGQGPLAAALDRFGHGLGIGLQMFDDVGNLRGIVEPAKRWEDLLLRRPSWVWACAARHYSADVFLQFQNAVNLLPTDARPLETWIELHDFPARARRLARQHVDGCIAELEDIWRAERLPLEPVEQIKTLTGEIARAYD